MLRDRAIISHIGLKPNQISIIQHSLQLPALKNNNFEFARADERRTPDVVFVNADEPDSMEKWESFSQVKKLSIPIMVSSAETTKADAITIASPLAADEVINALHAIAETDKPLEVDNKVCKEALTVLVVDDSFLVRKFMSHMLPKLFCGLINIEFAGTGEEAIEMAQTTAFDMVFLDIMLPGIDGYKVCKWFKANQLSYIVMLTGKKNPADKARGIMSGCNGYLTKPPKVSELQQVVDKIREKDHSYA